MGQIQSYRHRRSEEVEVAALRKAYGVTTGTMRRRAPVKNLVSEEEVHHFFDDWLPRRSTVAPSTAGTQKQRSVARKVASTPRAEKKRRQRKSDKRNDPAVKPLLNRITIKRRVDFTPKDDPAVKALLMILKQESRSMRKKILKQKIAETKRDIKRLEALKVVKTRKSVAEESEEFADWLGKSIEDQEVERMRHKTFVRPIAKIRSSGQTYLTKVRSTGLTGKDVLGKGKQTKVHNPIK